MSTRARPIDALQRHGKDPGNEARPVCNPLIPLAATYSPHRGSRPRASIGRALAGRPGRGKMQAFMVRCCGAHTPSAEKVGP